MTSLSTTMVIVNSATLPLILNLLRTVWFVDSFERRHLETVVFLRLYSAVVFRRDVPFRVAFGNALALLRLLL